MTYDPNDPNRVLGSEPDLRRPRMNDDGAIGWAVPAAFAALVLIIGALFMFNYAGNDRTTTASNNPPATTRSAPAPTPAPPVTPPVTTPKQ